MITFTDEEWAVIDDFLSTTLSPISDKIGPYNGYDCLRTRINYGMFNDVEKAELLAKLGLK